MKAILALVAVMLAAGSVACGSPLSTAEETQTAVAGGAGISSVSPTPAGGMTVLGEVWLNARSDNGFQVVALAGATKCGSTKTAIPMDGWVAIFLLHISPDAPGACTMPGAEIDFTVDGTPASATATYAADAEQRVSLMAGPPFARYQGAFSDPGDLPSSAHVEALIGGVVCGIQLNMFQGGYAYDIVVDPAEVTLGCGLQGSTVQLQLVKGPARDIGSRPAAPAAGTPEVTPLDNVAWSASLEGTKVPDSILPTVTP